MKLSQIQTQKQIFAPFLQQSISILFLPQAELSLAIDQELEENPLLESEPETAKILGDQPHVPDNNWGDNDGESEISNKISLADSLTQQLRLEIGDKKRFEIGEFIIGNLDGDGFLSLSIEEIAETTGVDKDIIEEVLEIIQNFEPVGIASRNLKECLCLQLKNNSGKPHAPLAIRIIQDCFEDLLHKKYLPISKKLKVSLEEIQEAIHLISSLDPKPARNYQSMDKSIYILPDVFVRKDPNDGLKVEMNRRGFPRLRINPIYQNLLNKKNIPEQEKVFIREKLAKAIDFIKSIQQRGETLLEISRFILERQKDFFNGQGSVLVPTTLKDVAVHINRCESTVSRAINGKYIDTPLGLFPLKFFFTQAMANDDNRNVSTYTIKEELQGIIEDEDKHSPLSDQQIQEYFRKKGLNLARRTVSKYRQELHIQPSHSRKHNGKLN